jgi:hypothetical protein
MIRSPRSMIAYVMAALAGQLHANETPKGEKHQGTFHPRQASYWNPPVGKRFPRKRRNARAKWRRRACWGKR